MNMDDENQYQPAEIIDGDRALATHCETFLTYGEMKQEDRMARITQSIADYREHHEAKAREPASAMLRDHLGHKFAHRRDIENSVLTQMREQAESPVFSWWQKRILRWAIRKLASPVFGT